MAYKQFRIEKDSLGEVKVPKKVLWGAQTQRAVNNFPISGILMNFPFTDSFISTLGVIKDASARANKTLGLLEAKKQKAISKAAKEVWQNKHGSQFPVDVFQTGSGTSTNMNANEVIANLATKYAGENIDPNDHVNMSQSSNDVIPTAILLSCHVDMTKKLMPALNNLIDIIDAKGLSVKGVIKTGRTHLMDAMPIDLSQELSGWSSQLKNSRVSLEDSLERLLHLPQGGTAIGTGINAHPRFSKEFCKEVSKLTNSKAKPMDNFFRGLSSQDVPLQLSGRLKHLSVALMKISNDLRWMNSGPGSGISDIALESLQPGSSIMPGKINPVIPESAIMSCYQVIGNDTTIMVCGQSGNFQLNVTLPIIAYNIVQSTNIISNTANNLSKKAIVSFKVNKSNIDNSINTNPILVTALNRIIGYEKGAYIAKKAYKLGMPILDVALKETDLSEKELKKILDPLILTKGGVK